jgi:CheY-like chemotaxis protein
MSKRILVVEDQPDNRQIIRDRRHRRRAGDLLIHRAIGLAAAQCPRSG